MRTFLLTWLLLFAAACAGRPQALNATLLPADPTSPTPTAPPPLAIDQECPSGSVDCGDETWCCPSDAPLCCGNGKCCPSDKPWACPSQGKCYATDEEATLHCDAIIMRCQ